MAHHNRSRDSALGLLVLAACVGIGFGALSAQEPKTGYCGENNGKHTFTLGPGSDIGGYSHGPEDGNCEDLHPSIHQS